MDFKYPYTDYHELNLDWFLSEFKNLIETWARTQQDWISMQEYIRDYFDNLNVQTEIDNKIEAMIQDGTFGAIVEPFVTAALPAMVAGQLPDVVAAQIGAVVAAQISAVVAGQLPAVAAAAAAEEVGTWLAAHIDPDTGYVIDDTLTVSQAAADAKTVGDALTILTDKMNDVNGNVNITWTNGAINASTGASATSTSFRRTNYIEVIPGDIIKLLIPVFHGAQEPNMFGYAFYDNNQDYLSDSGTSMPYVADSADNTEKIINIMIPAGAAYFRTTYYRDTYTSYTSMKIPFMCITGNSYTKYLFEKMDDVLLKSSINANRYNHYKTLGSSQIYNLTSIPADSFTVNLTNLYDAYDQLVIDYPDFIKRESDLGLDESGTYYLRHYCIRTKTGLFASRNDANITDANNLYDIDDNDYNKRRILVTSGMHAGTEKDCIKGTLAAIREIITSNEPWAIFIRSNFVIDIVPCINPWGLENNRSTNVNGVNLNRDFQDRTQAETLEMISLINDLADKNLAGVIDAHNSGNAYGYSHWVTKTSYPFYDDYIRMASELNTALIPLLQTVYGRGLFNDYYLFIWNYASSAATGQMHEYVNDLGILGMSCEARDNENAFAVTQMMIPNIINQFGTFEKLPI